MSRRRRDASPIVSPLLRLPAELRNDIYRYVLGDRTVHVSETLEMTITPEMQVVTLTLVCRQIYADTRFLFWSTSTFVYADAEDLIRWLSDFPVDCHQAISTIKICVHVGLIWRRDDTLVLDDLCEISLAELPLAHLGGLSNFHVSVEVAEWNYEYDLMKEWNGMKLARAMDRLLEGLKAYVESSVDGVKATLDFVTFGGSR